MKPIHIALAVTELNASIAEYTHRLGVEPVCVVPGRYALWRTAQLNFSINEKPEIAGQLRHLGFEDPNAPNLTESHDCNGIMWERFTAEQQRDEIFSYWPNADYPESKL
ncbi:MULTISPECIES: hypothetical protein [unclassified Endozoicomonas]|uniref:hypothetical protein n=1 Tax=unclassified Endozoicomonas TaxID=2644528 RepID=UPI003BB793CE